MSTFYYSDTETVDSSVVDQFWYNEVSNELAVSVRGNTYVYSDVSVADYVAATSASSPGSVFQSIKRTYGPSTYLGETLYVDFVSEFDDEEGFEDDEYPTEDTPLYDVLNAGTPKAMTYAENATLDGIRVSKQPTNNENVKQFSLTPANLERQVTRPHTVFFKHGGSLKVHKLNATSVDEAVSAVKSLANALGVEVKIESVTVYFE